MLIKKYLYIAVVCVLLSACSAGGEGGESDVPNPPEPAKPTVRIPIDISTTITRATETAFENGDQIGLFVVNRNADGTQVALQPAGNHVDNMLYTYSDVWTPATPVYWKDDWTCADFYMYYPYRNTVSSVSAMPFDVAADQSSVCIQGCRPACRQHAQCCAQEAGCRHSGKARDEPGGDSIEGWQRLYRCLVSLGRGVVEA